LFTDDDVAGSVIVAINRAYSAGGQRQTRKNCSRARESGCPFGKRGNGIEIAAFCIADFPSFHRCHFPLNSLSIRLASAAE
jgi:hypothetical protein